jgi:CheY-like chemotaxis protein/Tfp pilus assembly protein PilZ
VGKGKVRDRRIVARCRVEFDGSQSGIKADSEDLSEGGIFVRTDQLLPTGATVTVRIQLPSRSEAKVTAKVAHVLSTSAAAAVGRHPGMGLQFFTVEENPDNAAGIAAVSRYLSAGHSESAVPISITSTVRVVVAEPSGPLRQRVSRSMGRVGFVVEAFADGADALEACQNRAPTVVVTANAMPGLDGPTLIRRLAHNPLLVNVPVVMISEDGSDLARLEAYRLGVREYIPKPFLDEELIIRVHRLAAPVRSNESTATLRGSLKEISVGTLLTLCEFEKKSGVLLLMRDGEIARLLMASGRIVKVETPSRKAPKERLMALLDWKIGQFEFTSGSVLGVDEIGISTTNLLLEYARKNDDAGGESAPVARRRGRHPTFGWE